MAYIIYTSGSTGRPKGVAVPHRAIVRLVRDTNYVRLGPGDRTGHVSNVSFDAATYEIWGALLNGAAVVVIPREVVLSPEAFAATLRNRGVTTMFLTSALFTRMSREQPDAFAGLSELLVGGEAVDPVAARTVLADRPPRRLLNGYGPTESTTFATWHPIRDLAPEAASIPIGLPLANTTVYVLDRWGQPVPPGVAGELLLGGDGLAWGYWNRPELTAERFVPDPWPQPDRSGGRLYRTGDVVRQQSAGPIEYLGRLDHQVKIRGFRIEPGEIEAVLAGHPEVRECVVLAREGTLVGYVVLDRTDPSDPADRSDTPRLALAAWLRARLPEYMLPSAWVLLEALPLTPNGKLDRRALPAPEEVEVAEGGYAPPQDPIEELLAVIWGEVLGRERVGVHDDFFALGGHSLLATQVASRIRGVLGVELALRSVFEEPTISGLARVVRDGLAGAGLAAPPLVRVSRDGELPLSFAQQRLWFIDQLEPGNPGYNIPAAMRLAGELSVPRLAGVFAEVVRRHEGLRTTFASREGRAVQVIHPAGGIELPLVDLSALPVEAREALARRLAVAESLRPFDLEQGPLLRLLLLRLDEREHLLLLTLHHIVSDGWSMGVLVRELQDLYRGRTLPELPIQYADFAAWQRQWLAGEVLALQLAWWREHLEGTSGVLELPVDHPRPAALSLRGAEHLFALDLELSRRLAELGRREGVTPFMILAAALFALLSRLSGQRDLNLAAPIANRNRIETEGLIGFFVNTLVLRADVGRAEVFLDLLVQVRDASLGAYAHQDLPFEKLVDEVQPERDLSRSPLVQVALAVNNAPVSRADLEGLRLIPETPPAEVAKFDLAFIFAETEDGSFAGSLQYATDLYDAATAVRLTRQLATFLDALTADPEQPLLDVSPLTAGERHQVLFEWNDTAEGVRSDVLLHQLFEAQADARPEATAAVCEDRSWSYRELEARANRLANWLAGLAVRRGTPVGVWMERSLPMLEAVLGILKAGGTYVPLDAAWPAERVETILAGTGAPVILVDRTTLSAVDEIRWRLPRLGDAVCLDIETPEPEPERVDAENVRSLFDFVAERATDRNDRVMAGGFVSRVTGLPFSEAEVDEYRDRVLSLAAPWLKPEARVLEVGSGSGLILWEMARQVARCVGLDPSERTQERNREHALAAGITNVELPVGFAHEIGEQFAPGSFNLIVLASTVQFFPGPRYLEKVVADALRLLAPGGALLLADLMLAEGLFHDLAAVLPEAGELEILHRTEGFANELGERYDVILHKGETERAWGQRRKRTWTGWHVERASSDRPRSVGSAEDVAYVIHTSGSTGLPKGIAVQHAPAVNLISWVNRTLGVGPDDRLLFVTSLCFDLSVYDVFGTLAAGGTVHVASEAALREPAELVRLLREEPVTIWDSAPAALQQLAPLFPPGERESEERPLRLVMLSGDWIPVPLPDQVRAAFPRTRVVSLGGATEATVWSNWYPVTEVDPRWPSIPYGRPIANARYHVLDDGLLPCPIGVPGDLYIGGSCLCVGYAGQPELTAAAFVPDPFGRERGARLYRTGDRARFFRDGNLEFLGRVDQQVKVRGYRIELGEIEVALLRHPAVREAVVVVWEQRLVAYTVLDRTDPTDPTDRSDPESGLTAWLRDRLPSYMLPSAYVVLESLPVTANGKLDRKALPAPELVPAESYEAPSDPVEETLAGLWGEILGLDRVGVRDNFFTLGGHSLLATQLMSRLRGGFGVELALRELFEAPTIAELARTVRRAQQAGSAQAPPPLLPVPREGRDLPLSFAQQRLWLLDQIEPGNPAYNIPLALRLAGELSVEALERTFAELVRRHEALRTTFSVQAGQPVQVISSPEAARPELRVVDLADAPEEAREEWARALALEEARNPFDLRSGPLLRLGLLRLAEREHLLLVTLHHVVADGWSMGVLPREIAALYEAFRLGRPSPLPELPLQYADFAVWQRSWLQGPVLEEQLGYWKRQLAGAPAALELPLDRPRPAVQTYRGASLPVALGPALSERVHALSRAREVTPFMTLLAVWAVLLGRHAGQDEVLVGSPIAGRTRREIEGLIGFFINTLVLRVELGGEPEAGSLSFRGLLGQVRRTALDAFAHQDVPFERLVEELVAERNLAVSPLFQAFFTLQNAPQGELAVPGLVLSPFQAETGLTKFDLTLTLGEGAGGFSGTLEFNTDLFDGTTAARYQARFETLLAAAVEDPDQDVEELPLLLPAEEQQVLREWNDTGAPLAGLCLHELFAAQAARTPDAVALIHREGALTYAGLAARAGGIAGRLRGLGVAPDARVAVCLERSPDLIASLLGVLAAGGAYVPIDPAYPVERRALMLEDSGAGVLVTRGALADLGARSATSRSTTRLDLDAEEIPDARLPVETTVTPGHLAYVIYTSGSTGRPKGVAIEHRSAVALAGWARETFSSEELGGLLAATSVCFDLSVFEIFGPLSWGGTVILMENVLELPTSPVASRVRVLNTVPSAAAELVRSGGLPPTVRTVCLAGEPLPAPLVDRLYALAPVERVLNLYGPSEDTTYSTGARMPRRPNGWERAPVIGSPLPGTRGFVVDRSGRPVPVGVAGELWLAGAGLARGYLGRPELTAERFTPDPFAHSEGRSVGGRVYRTGDLARWLPDGNLEFLGRRDQQVKVRGFRIELGEIEVSLASHPAVRDAVVVARREEPGDVRLVAYVTPAGTAPPSVAELRSRLQAELPPYMVPAAFVVLETLPRLPNGKIDRSSLPAPERPAAEPARGAAAGRRAAEEILLDLFAEVLGRSRVGPRDSFFELGGHSLLAMQLLVRMRGVFGVDLPLRRVFDSPTAADLAGAVEEALRGGAIVPPPMAPVVRAGALPLSSAQHRLWFVHQIDPASPAYNVPLAVRIDGPLRAAALAASLREIVCRHEALRTTFQMIGGQPVQVIAPPPAAPLAAVDLSGLPPRRGEEQASGAARAMADVSFDLARGPVFRAALVELSAESWLLLLTIHHVALDGRSARLLVRELTGQYQALLQGQPADLPELPVQYADYAWWERSWMQGEVLAEHLRYWLGQLDGLGTLPDLPGDRPRPAVPTWRAGRASLILPSDLAEALRKLGRGEGTTLFMTLLAGLDVLLHLYTEADDVVIGSGAENRLRSEVEPLIGCFFNLLVLRADLSGGPTFRELLARVRETTLGAYAHQALPFDWLMEAWHRGRADRDPRIFHMLFELQDGLASNAAPADLTFTWLDSKPGVVKYDLSLFVREQDGELLGDLEYNADLFSPGWIGKLLEDFRLVLEEMVWNPDGAVDGIDLGAGALEMQDALAGDLELD